ncbi:RelA/SpoT family protein [Desulfovibrio litoralis]|uniref:RelA/SpoT family protein n=1 Tax=Desulfovibrio litoralis TaxID=466107 RepID=UPI0009341D2F|nr:bifunctional (p)ppGpp synthetase/guanosine-3',5'-bis(diphosphate) 3'-pyrophosphohydrolase [Desulfovibrio litoralis]
MKKIQEILQTVEAYYPSADLELIKKVYDYASTAHDGQTRLSGEPYFFHPLAVAEILADLRMDEATICASLLHDTVEDTSHSIEDIDEAFGEEIADIVDGVTKISMLTFDSKEEQQAENIRKMILATSEDIRVLIVKLADRLHNMRTLEFQKPHKRVRISQETMDIYAPLANRLGLHRLKLELEDLSFRYLQPETFNTITKWIDENQADDAEYIAKVINILEDILVRHEIKGRVKGRTKHIYSIYRKMTSQSLRLEDMHDIIAFRVIVDDVSDCYAVLGYVHEIWTPVPGRFKDYISMPKANDYKSLHTTVLGPGAERMEVQIRTEDMDLLAENGLASHWLYKEGGRVRSKDIKQFNWLREMLDWQKLENDPKEFLRSLRSDLFKDEIYIFTPKGTVKELPEHATAVDFAYQIHTQIGDRCSGAKINNKLLPLSTPLKNGDVVEIITKETGHPNRDWLKFVKTAKARTRIQSYIRTEERSRSIALGQELLEKHGRRVGVNFHKLVKEADWAPVLKELNYRSLEDMISAVGYTKLSSSKILRFFVPKIEEKNVSQTDAPLSPHAKEKEKEKEKAQNKKLDTINITGVDGILVRYAKCCTPIVGDAIVGFISRGRGVTVHTADCLSLANAEVDRLITLSWEGQNNDPLPAKIRIIAVNSPGVLAQITTNLAEMGVNIDAGNFRSAEEGITEIDLTVVVKDVVQLYVVIDKVRHIPTVSEVVRLKGE